MRLDFQVRDLHNQFFRHCDEREFKRLLTLGVAVRTYKKKTIRLTRPAFEIYKSPARPGESERRRIERVLFRSSVTGRSYVVREPVGDVGSGLFAYRHDLPRGYGSVPIDIPIRVESL